VTDDNGRYEFKDVPPGSYTISINQSGFAPLTNSDGGKTGRAAVVIFGWSFRPSRSRWKSAEAACPWPHEDATTQSVALTQHQLISLPTAQEKIRESPGAPGVVKTMERKLDFKGSDENQVCWWSISARLRSGDRKLRVAAAHHAVQSSTFIRRRTTPVPEVLPADWWRWKLNPPDDGFSYA